MTSRPSPAAAVTAALALALAVGLTACSPETVIEGVVEDQTGVDVDDDGSVTIKGEDGSAEISADENGLTMTDENGTSVIAGTGLPDGFPADVPLPDLEIAYAMSQTTDVGTAFSVGMAGPGGREAFDEASNLLTAAGYSSDDSQVVQAGDAYVGSATFTGAHTVVLSLMGDDKEAILGYVIDGEG